jgi:acyl-CoA thioesterase
LFGGSGLGAAISALEGTSGRPCIWATAQYLAYAKPGEVLDIDVTLVVQGHQITQARAIGHVDNREILTVNAALGDRPFASDGQWATMPVTPPPNEVPRRPYRLPVDGTIVERLDLRMVAGRAPDELDGSPGSGRTLMWARIPELIEDVDAAALAILGDYVPMGVGQALGLRAGGNSLDNTLRVVRLVPTDWVLIEVRAHGVGRGFGHGSVHLWSEDGVLLATASQSCIMRFWRLDSDHRPPRGDDAR